ncbi:Sodium:neurotransmitter symporter [Trinorchestia longiramus]|nr:Sodium:neurotransmitter symporter [Trinorchestia longiramus]
MYRQSQPATVKITILTSRLQAILITMKTLAILACRLQDTLPEQTANSYRNSSTNNSSSSNSTPKQMPHVEMSNSVSSPDIDLNVDQDAPSKNKYDKIIDKTSNVTSEKSEVDLDAKWKANYVPCSVPSTTSTSTTTTAEVSTVNGHKTSSKNGGSQTEPSDEDELDAKWRKNYVPCPYNVNKVELQDSPPILSPPSSFSITPRPQWGNKAEFLFSCFSLTVGIGNVVRFPYMAYNHGGGAFLLLYVVCLVLVGIPLYFLELGLGQYAQLGPLNVFKCVSAMQGIGLAMSVLSLLTAVYANQMVAFCLHYLFASLAYIGHPLPWSSCGHSWSTKHCYEMGSERSVLLGNTTIIAAAAVPTSEFRQSAAQQYFLYQVLHQPVFKAPSEYIGTIRWDLTLCLLLAWTLVFLVLSRGVRSTGKAAYALAVIPTVAIFVLMINGLLMRGADLVSGVIIFFLMINGLLMRGADLVSGVIIFLMINGLLMRGADLGLLYLFTPRWSELTNLDVWARALEQVLFSLSVAYGGVIMYGSYNSFRNKVHIDAVVICLCDFAVSIVASVAVFSVLGAMAYELGITDIAQLPDMGQSVALVVYPSAIGGAMQIPHLWAVIFYIALATLGIGSLVGHVHTVVGGILDTLPRLRSSAMLVAGVICCSCFLLGLPLCAEERGYFLLDMLSRYGVGLSVLVVAACELLTLSWLYGVRRLSEDLAFMLGYTPSMFWKVCWAFLSPTIVIVMIVFSAVTWNDPATALDSDPAWATLLRWIFTAVSIGWIPIVFVIIFFKRLVTKQLSRLMGPALSWSPGSLEAREQLVAARSAGEQTKIGIDNPGLSYNN